MGSCRPIRPAQQRWTGTNFYLPFMQGAYRDAGALTRFRPTRMTEMRRETRVQDLIWVGVSVGLLALSLLYVTLADRA